MKKTIITKTKIIERAFNIEETNQAELDRIENDRIEKIKKTNLRIAELIEIMTQANALRDDVAWQEAKEEYDNLQEV